MASLAAVAALGDPPEGWDAVAAVACAGRLEPMVLRTFGQRLPERVRARLQARARRVAFAAMWHIREREQIMRTFAARGLAPVVLLKGAVLGHLVYPDPALRSTNDLDLLVRERDAARAGEILRSMGYTETNLFPTRPASRAAYHERLYSREVVAGRVRQPVEVHTGFAQSFRHPIPYPVLMERAVPFPEGGPEARRLDDADQLLHLAAHLAREQFLSPLKHLFDVDRWVRRGGFSWGTLLGRAIEYGLATSLFETLRLAATCFDTPVPPEAAAALEPGRTRGAWLRWWHHPRAGGLTRRPASMRRAQALALLPLLDDPISRARFVGHYLGLRVADAWARQQRGSSSGSADRDGVPPHEAGDRAGPA